MSRIQTIAPNYQPKTANLKKNQTSSASNQSFGGVKPKELEGASKEVYYACEKQLVNKFTWLSEKLAIKDSEIEKQLINALFTATLAPVVIGWNPFSKQDDKTKKYMALRQPISAGVAIAGGVALTKPIDDWLAKIASEGCVPSYDMRMAPDKDYIKKQFKKDYNAAADKKSFLAGFKPEDFKAEEAEGNMYKRWKYKNACLDGYVKKTQDATKEVFKNLTGLNPSDLEIEETTSTIKNKISGEVIAKNIPNINTKKDLDAFLASKNLHNISTRDFLKEKLKFDFFEDGQLQPDKTTRKLTDIKAIDFLEKFGIKGFTEQQLVTALDEIRQKDTIDNINKALQPKQKEELNKEVNAIFEKIEKIENKGDALKTYNESIKDLAEVLKKSGAALEKCEIEAFVIEMAKQNKRSIQGLIGEQLADAKSLTLGQMLHRFKYMEYDGDKSLVELQKFMDGNVSDAIVELKKHLKHLKGTNEDGKVIEKVLDKKSVIDFAGNILKTDIGIIEKRFKAYKGYVGIISNLFIVVVTCTALNWIYPRLVEILFPNLVKSDKPAETQKGGNK